LIGAADLQALEGRAQEIEYYSGVFRNAIACHPSSVPINDTAQAALQPLLGLYSETGVLDHLPASSISFSPPLAPSIGSDLTL